MPELFKTILYILVTLPVLSFDSLRASSPISASEASFARTRERAAKPPARAFSRFSLVLVLVLAFFFSRVLRSPKWASLLTGCLLWFLSSLDRFWHGCYSYEKWHDNEHGKPLQYNTARFSALFGLKHEYSIKSILFK